MSGTTKRKYGLDWPAATHDILIDLICAKHWKLDPYAQAQLLDPGEHMLRACRALFTHDQFSISPWTEEHAHAWCNEDFLLIWGCASSSKSSDIGLFTLLDWITDPTETVSLLCSTTRTMLELRSYESVIRYFRLLKSHPTFLIPGKQSKQAMAIINDDAHEDEPTSTVKASIRGVAVQQGTTEDARGNLQGAHLPFVRLILDEGEAIREAAFEARTNLSIAGKGFKMVILANPETFTGRTGRYAEPLDGWASVSVDSTSWRSRYGLVLHHDGMKSPAITDPDGRRKYPYLINQGHIDRILAEESGNAEAPRVYTMVRGWPSPQGLERAVISESEIIAFGARDPVVWGNDPQIRVAGLDPAFTSDGDGCIFASATIAHDARGQPVFVPDPTVAIPLVAGSDVPISYQIVNATRTLLQERSIPVNYLAVDDSGSQSIADLIDREIAPGCLRVNFASKPTDRALTAAPGALPADERCQDAVTEMWLLLAEFIRFRNVRLLPDVVVSQLIRRRFRKTGKIQQLESKADHKKRLGGRSPDETDALALAARVARDRVGFYPGGVPGGMSPPPQSKWSLNPHQLFSQIRTKYLDRQGPGRLGSYAYGRNRFH